MKSKTGDRRQHQRYTVESSITVTNDGVFQLTDVSIGGFCYKCPPNAVVPDEWVADILTPIGDLKKYFAKRKWVADYEDEDPHFPPLIKVGAKFGQLTKDQQGYLAELINSVSMDPTDWKIDKWNAL